MILLLVLFSQSPIANHQSPIAEMALGDSLLKHGFNDVAVQEFKRLSWLNESDSALAGRVHFKLGLSLAAASQLADAAEELQEAARSSPELSEPTHAAMTGYYARAKRYDLAAFELSDILVFTRDSARRAKLESAMGWLQLHEGDVASAARSYDLAGMQDVAGVIRSSDHGPSRNSTLAAAMSTLLPGSGEVYAGQPAKGLLAFAVNAGSLAWATAAAKSGDWVSASVIIGVLFWRFYNGSRSNAAAFADDFNSLSRQRRIERLAAERQEPDWFGEVDSVLGYPLRPADSSAHSVPSLR
ncbi:MAG TPA: hypothetical protein VMH22_09275 [bacterium]|nr:hypothetical protein [bacterium]